MEGTIGEVRLFAANFAPRSWAYCQGQLLPIASYTALFSIIGTTYGGDGKTTFALPDFQGRLGTGAGNGPGLSNYNVGQKTGAQSVTLTENNLASHNHVAVGTVVASSNAATTNTPTNETYAVPGGRDSGGNVVVSAYAASYDNTGGNPGADITIHNNGGNIPVDLFEPVLGMNYIICLQGVFPSRN